MKALKATPIEVHITTVKAANQITGGLSDPDKMPGKAFGLPISACKRGSVMRKIKGSVCEKCYAGKGHYVFKPVKVAQERRLKALEDPLWVEAMAFLIGRDKSPYFRWHDSGHLQGEEHLHKIFSVCKALPKKKFWMPTRELELVKAWVSSFPRNLIVRASSSMINGRAPAGFLHTSTVVSKDHRAVWSALVANNTKLQHFCPAPLQEGKCGKCRACWSSAVKNTTYLQH